MLSNRRLRSSKSCSTLAYWGRRMRGRRMSGEEDKGEEDEEEKEVERRKIVM